MVISLVRALCRPNLDKWITEGEVTERLKVHDWKSCVLQKSTGGSNPPLSATVKKRERWKQKSAVNTRSV